MQGFWQQLLLHWQQSAQTLLKPDRRPRNRRGGKMSETMKLLPPLRSAAEVSIARLMQAEVPCGYIHTLVMQAYTHAYTVSLSGLIEHNLSHSTSKSPTQSELKLHVVCLPSSLSHCCAHASCMQGLARPPKHVNVYFYCRTTGASQPMYLLVFDVFFFPYASACWQGICDEKSKLQISLPVFLSSLQGLSVVCILLSSPLLSDLPSDLVLSLSQRADSRPGNCMSAGHHTCCCQCSGVGERWRRFALSPTTTFVAGVNPEGGGSVIVYMCIV